MQALILAAGMGKRLKELTNGQTKCMVEVNGEKLIDRAIKSLRDVNIKKIIVVIGYMGENLSQYLLNKYKNTDIELIFINNKDYATSNNIYSFYLAKDYLLKDTTVLLESDLIFDSSLLKKLIACPYKNVAVVAKYDSWMDGTVVTLDKNHNIIDFIRKNDMDLNHVDDYFKTVNIYKFSPFFIKDIYLPYLTQHMKEFGLNDYYETVLKKVVSDYKNAVQAYNLKGLSWYEIDNCHDLEEAKHLFSKNR